MNTLCFRCQETPRGKGCEIKAHAALLIVYNIAWH